MMPTFSNVLKDFEGCTGHLLHQLSGYLAHGHVNALLVLRKKMFRNRRRDESTRERRLYHVRLVILGQDFHRR